MINREIGIMTRMDHPTIIKFYGYSLKDFDGKDNVTLFMQLASKGSLADLLKKVQQGLADDNYDNTARQKILIGIARGMMYLHQRHAIHRDLKPDNILLDEDLEPHITDFGLSKFVSSGDTTNQTQTMGTSFYMAPEVIETDQYNGKADVYSFGILMYEVVTDMYPFPDFQNKKMSLFRLNSKVINENYRPQFKSPVKEKIQQLIEKCWSPNPKERPTFEEIYNRLSRNIEDSVYNVFEDDQSQYYLDDVDTEAILDYLDKIESDDEERSKFDLNQLFTKIEKLEKSCSKIDQLSIENDNMKQIIKNLKKQNEELLSKVDHLSIENSQIKQQLNCTNTNTVSSTSKIVEVQNQPIEKVQLNSNEKVTSRSVEIKDQNEDPYGIKVHIKMLQAKDISKLKMLKKPDPYVKVCLKSSYSPACRTTFNMSTLNPVWNKEFVFYTNDPNDVLLINMYNFDNDKRLMDEVRFPINSLTIGGPLCKQELDITRKNKSAGKLFFEVQSYNIELDVKPFCSFSVTGETFIKEKYYRCYTCNLTPENHMGICESCAKICHKGHNISLVDDDYIFSYCDCPGKCKCCCLAETSDLPCTSIEFQGKPINQPMYHCSDCDSTGELFICQNCAMKYHHGHKTEYIGIVESKVCQNGKIKQ